VGLYTDTSKLKWIFWTSHHSVLAYRYVVKIEQKFKHQNKREFRSANPQQPKYDKDDPNKQSPKNQSKPQEKKGHGKTKKDTGKWCDFHKIPWHNTDECHSK
jgi:hypothetical protein